MKPWWEITPQEAARCLNCAVCCECMQCVQACEAGAIDHTMAAEEVKLQVGSIILATGYGLLDPTPLIPYGYGRYPNVFTSLEFEVFDTDWNSGGYATVSGQNSNNSVRVTNQANKPPNEIATRQVVIATKTVLTRGL